MGFGNCWKINILKIIRMLTVIFIDENVYQLSRLQIELWGGIFCLMLYIFAIRLTLESNKKGYTLDIVQNNKLIHGKI